MARLIRAATLELNLRGRKYQQLDQAGLVTYSAYDAWGNLLECARQIVRGVSPRIDWSCLDHQRGLLEPDASLLDNERFTTSATWSQSHRLLSRTTPDGTVTRFGYNELDQLVKVEVFIRGSVQAIPIVDHIDYDPHGLKRRIVYGNGVITLYQYEPDTLRLSRLTSIRADGAKLQDYRYTYDAVGNPVEIKDEADPLASVTEHGVAAICQYRYDSLYRLIEASGRECGDSGADSNLNFLGDDLVLSGPLRHYLESYFYDRGGNLVRKKHDIPGGKGWSRSWVPAHDSNRLQATTFPGLSRPALLGRRANPTLRVWFDAGGQRIRQVLLGPDGRVDEERIYLDSFEVLRRSGQASDMVQEERTLHVLDGNERFALMESAGSRQPLIRYPVAGSPRLRAARTGRAR